MTTHLTLHKVQADVQARSAIHDGSNPKVCSCSAGVASPYMLYQISEHLEEPILNVCSHCHAISIRRQPPAVIHAVLACHSAIQQNDG